MKKYYGWFEMNECGWAIVTIEVPQGALPTEGEWFPTFREAKKTAIERLARQKHWRMRAITFLRKLKKDECREG